MKFLNTSDVIEIHDLVIDRSELQGIAGGKSLDALLTRIENRMSFGMISDEFDLAACYACFLAVGYVFNDDRCFMEMWSIDILEMSPLDIHKIIYKLSCNQFLECTLKQEYPRTSLFTFIPDFCTPPPQVRGGNKLVQESRVPYVREYIIWAI